MSQVLICNAVRKLRRQTPVLEDISLGVAAGTRLALLGHNGAGKSTLIKLVLGLIRLDAGDIRIDGAVPGSDEARHSIAYLPEAVAFQGALTGREMLILFAQLKGVAKAETGPILERVGLGSAADRRIATYSKGMRQRLGLAQVLLGRPKLALLDEPASGLDPVSRHELYAIIDEMAAAGTAVLIASHALTEVEARTDHIAILSQGRLVAHDSLQNLAQRAGLPIILRVRAVDSSRADQIANVVGGKRINGASIEIRCAHAEKMRALHHLSGLGSAVSDIDIIPPGLEDLYRHYSGALS